MVRRVTGSAWGARARRNPYGCPSAPAGHGEHEEARGRDVLAVRQERPWSHHRRRSQCPSDGAANPKPAVTTTVDGSLRSLTTSREAAAALRVRAREIGQARRDVTEAKRALPCDLGGESEGQRRDRRGGSRLCARWS